MRALFLWPLLAGLAGAGSLREAAVGIDWAGLVRAGVRTSAQIEVDVMPFLSRAPEGGPFGGYYRALSSLGAELVRFSPWFGYPLAVVPELERTTCQGSRWNSTTLDGLVADFMQAVCGPGAAEGRCEHSVAQQLSTMPLWLYKEAQPSAPIPADPWRFPSGRMGYYSQGSRLVDPSCAEMARFAARFVGWYTAGGFVDECGAAHRSGLRYNWTYLSVLNEEEHHFSGEQYARCFESWRLEVAKVNPSITLIGPEAVTSQGLDLQGNLTPVTPERRRFVWEVLEKARPPVLSVHVSIGMRGQRASMFEAFDRWFETMAVPLMTRRDQTSPATQLALNELITEIWDWCPSDWSPCPDASLANSTGLRINRKTLGWSSAAAAYAYAFARLMDAGWLFVTADQLVAGPYPDNCPFVASLDWTTGQPNAKYWAVRMLAAAFGTRSRRLVETTVSSVNGAARIGDNLYARGFVMDDSGGRGCLVVNKLATALRLHGFESWNGAVLEAAGPEPGTFRFPEGIRGRQQQLGGRWVCCRSVVGTEYTYNVIIIAKLLSFVVVLLAIELLKSPWTTVVDLL